MQLMGLNQHVLPSIWHFHKSLCPLIASYPGRWCVRSQWAPAASHKLALSRKQRLGLMAASQSVASIKAARRFYSCLLTWKVTKSLKFNIPFTAGWKTFTQKFRLEKIRLGWGSDLCFESAAWVWRECLMEKVSSSSVIYFFCCCWGGGVERTNEWMRRRKAWLSKFKHQKLWGSLKWRWRSGRVMEGGRERGKEGATEKAIVWWIKIEFYCLSGLRTMGRGINALRRRMACGCEAG